MKQNIEITVNGCLRQLAIDTRTTLVELLREHLDLTGAHIGCATGNCGACTVLLSGQTVKSCSVLAVDTDGQEVLTVEGLTSDAALHPIQQAFVRHYGLQCGYCTPGMVLSAYFLLQHLPHPSEEEIRHGIAGNLCRCTGYQFIVDAIKSAAEEMA